MSHAPFYSQDYSDSERKVLGQALKAVSQGGALPRPPAPSLALTPPLSMQPLVL